MYNESISYHVDGARLPRVPFHAVQTHEHSSTDEQSHPHKDVASAMGLVRQKDERNFQQTKQESKTDNK